MSPRRSNVAAMVGVLALAGTVGCASLSEYQPKHVGPAELTLRYEKGVTIYSGRRYLTRGPRYDGLAEHVRCVPLAYEHARYAQKHGRSRVGLAWSGGALGVASLGGLSGFAFLEEQPKTAFALLGAGLGVAVLGIVLAGSSRSAGNQAHGNAIDALNYYNDAVGSLGGSCDDAPGEAPEYVPPPTARLIPAPPRPAEPAEAPMEGPSPAGAPAEGSGL